MCVCCGNGGFEFFSVFTVFYFPLFFAVIFTFCKVYHHLPDIAGDTPRSLLFGGRQTIELNCVSLTVVPPVWQCRKHCNWLGWWWWRPTVSCAGSFTFGFATDCCCVHSSSCVCCFFAFFSADVMRLLATVVLSHGV